MTRIEWTTSRFALEFAAPGDAPVSLVALAIDGGENAVAPHAIVDLFTAGEHRRRTSQAFVRSAAGERLRYRSHEADASHLSIRQHDDATGLEVTTSVRALGDGLQWTQTIHNLSDRAWTLTAASSLTLELADRADARLLWGESEWLAEGRWHEQGLGDVLPDLGLDSHRQDGRGRFVRSSHGAWSTGEYLPTGAIVRDGGPSVAWQVETSAGWSWELAQTEASVVIAASGPGDLEHQFAERLEPGMSFTTVPVGLVVADGGRDAVFAELAGYRRALRLLRPADESLPVVYNDYMNTLMGQPSTEELLPLIEAAAAAGTEVFCIDAGWFTDDTDYWSAIGVWTEAPSRFTGGLASVIDEIRSRGMGAGLWLEPEIVGVDSPAAQSLPDDAFFRRFGERVIESERLHLDLRHPAARAHLDETVDRLVEQFGVSYFKLDYNINPGVGTDHAATSAGAGLLGHTRALRAWLIDVQARHPEVLFENCASGAMRMDYALLSVAHQQSTSDQQDAVHYAPIAASAPASVLPEQAGNWAYPAAGMSAGETAVTLVNGLAGRFMLSGFLPQLREDQTRMVSEAVTLHTSWRDRLSGAVPSWPLGLPGWDDDVIALALRSGGETFLCVWSRGAAGQVVLPGLGGAVRTTFPAAGTEWPVAVRGGDLVIEVPAGPDARVLVL
ncbi:alpha-galactosidase [Microbacterium bovistercoris]|uniref:Alpha-galactosidase n=1 Tax=Microbacterium bovistercoris TaxID=2293570 RepID=A0A371NZA2_9MICO|nr:glycoside hydrolase family 36 protein [Microbacterium bovistercoris]REJ08721.1 alpha-galactosidase [Microbacterium bovistercoris]